MEYSCNVRVAQPRCRAYELTSNLASHDDHEKRNSLVSMSMVLRWSASRAGDLLLSHFFSGLSRLDQ